MAQAGCGGDPQSQAFSADVVFATYPADQGLQVASDLVAVDLDTLERRVIAQATAFEWSPDRRSILFERDRHLYLTPATASDAIHVAEGDGLDDLQAKNWSPDSSHIAFRNGYRLLAARPDGKDTVELSNQTVLSWQWAPAGAHLIHDAGLPLRLASLDGTASQELGRPRDNDWFARDGWSSDGLRFAYVSYTDDAIWVHDVYGGDRVVGQAENSQAFAWSPDGSRLAHSTANGVAITLADGSGVIELSNEPVTPGLGQFFGWAPDGSRLAYRVGVNLWTALPDGSDRRPVEGSTGISTIYWSPDSSRLAFIVSTESPGVLWMASKTGADARQRSPDHVVLACEWAPDATRIGCLEQANSGEQRVRIVPADGGDIVLPVTSTMMGIQWSPRSEFVAVSMGDNALASNSPTNWRTSLFAADGTSEIPLDDESRGSGLWSSDGNWYVHTDGTVLHATNLSGERRLVGGTTSRPFRRFEVR